VAGGNPPKTKAGKKRKKGEKEEGWRHPPALQSFMVKEGEIHMGPQQAKTGWGYEKGDLPYKKKKWGVGNKPWREQKSSICQTPGFTPLAGGRNWWEKKGYKSPIERAVKENGKWTTTPRFGLRRTECAKEWKGKLEIHEPFEKMTGDRGRVRCGAALCQNRRGRVRNEKRGVARNSYLR